MGAIRTLPNHLETSNIELEECTDKLSGVTRSIRYLANCDLASGVRSLSNVEEDELRAHLSTMMGNLSAVIDQTRECSESFLAALPKIGALANQTDEYTALMEKINLQFSELSEAIQKNACLTEELQSIADVTGDDAQVAKDTVQTVVAAMDDIALHSNQISQFTEIVDQIAFQTNLLALNAAVEAARAGEEGRGFAVVANEVRNLAQRSGSAAKEITHFINESTQSVNSGRESVADVSQKMTKVSSRVDTLKDLIQDVSNTTQYQGEKFDDVKGTVEELDAFALQNAAMAEDVLKVAEQLNDNADYLNNTVSIFQMPESFTHLVHQRMLAHAIECAEEVSALFEWAIEEGQIETESLFSREYEVIPNTNPTRYHTPFDHFCDRYLPIIQEAIIQCDPEVVFAITADNNGYVPTHNDEFCQPLTGNPKIDTAHNRTKRIFDDHVGKMVGRHTKEYLLQIYRRDTGVIMFDISVPVYVNGQHWGGFRVGYKIS